MNAHAFRSDDLATACRLDVEEQERKRQKDAKRAERRERAVERQRRFMDWYEYDGVVLIWSAFVFVLAAAAIAIGGMCSGRIEAASATRDKIACYRVCKAVGKSTILAVGDKSLDGIGRLCACFRQDGVRVELVAKERFEALRQ